MRLDKILTASFASIILTSYAFAEDDSVSLRGTMNFQGVHYKSTGKRNQRYFSTYQENYGFYSAGSVYAQYNLVSNSGLKYGTKIGIEHTFKNTRAIPASVYIESDLGKLEGGSDSSAGHKMKITPYTASCDEASGWDFLAKISPDKNRLSYISSFSSFLDVKMRVAGKVEYSRKVSYYTPKISISDNNKVQFGISYIPDSSNMGNGDINENILHRPLSSLPYKVVIKDGISYGVTHEVSLSEKTKVRTSFVGEYGIPYCYWIRFDANGKEINGRTAQQVKNLNFQVLGTEITYNNTSVALSYGDYKKSLTAVEIDKFGRDGKLYGAGVKYKFDKYTFSVNYLNSIFKQNELDALTLAAEKAFAKGVKTYLHTTVYQTRGKYFNTNNKLTFDKTKGSLIILGAKVVF